MHIQSFRIQKSTDQQLFLIFPDDHKLGYLSEKLANAFNDLIGQTSIECEAIANLSNLSKAIRRAKKPSDAAMRVNINVYGAACERDRIGKVLSDKELYLQTPDRSRPGAKYDNPHILKLDGMDNLDDCEKSGVDESSPEPSLGEGDEIREKIEEVLSSLKRGQGLHRLEGSNNLKKPLFP